MKWSVCCARGLECLCRVIDRTSHFFNFHSQPISIRFAWIASHFGMIFICVQKITFGYWQCIITRSTYAVHRCYLDANTYRCLAWWVQLDKCRKWQFNFRCIELIFFHRTMKRTERAVVYGNRDRTKWLSILDNRIFWTFWDMLLLHRIAFKRRQNETSHCVLAVIIIRFELGPECLLSINLQS